MQQQNFMAKRVLFLYPHSVIQQEMVRELVSYEYSVQLVNDHERLRAVVNNFEQPIIFVNIDEHLSNEEWKDYIQEMTEATDNDAQIGVLTYNDDSELASFYLMELMIPCGFIKLKLGLEQSRKIIHATLEANEANGRRKYLRLDCWNKSNTELNFKNNEYIFSGRIKDISSVGMAFVLNEDLQLNKHTVVSDIQLKLRGKIARVSGPVMGQRETPDGVIYVMLFDKTVTPDTRGKIHSFIYDMLQEEMSKILYS